MDDETAEAAAPASVIWDRAFVLERLRQGGAERAELIAKAYEMTFGGEMGRIVLMDHLIACGVGRIFGAEMTDAQLRYSAGIHDGAIMLAQAAGFDQAALAAAAMTETLTEEMSDERSSDPAGFTPGPGDEF